jgi:hypothetical protein
LPSLKQIGTICFVFSLILISTKSYSDIAANNSNPSCDNSTLNTYTGPAALEAKWNANTIQLKWYKDDELLTVQTAANQCTYDGTMTLPSTRPTKTGYDFNGWKVKTGGSSSGGGSSGGLMCGLTNETIGAEIVHTWAKGIVDNETICRYDAEDAECSSDAVFSSLGAYSWKVQSSTGVYEGVASCNSTNVDRSAIEAQLEEQLESGAITEEEATSMLFGYGSRAADALNSGGTGANCWCRATSYNPNNGQQCESSSSSWLFLNNPGTDGCLNTCATYCAYFFQNVPYIRSLLLSN